MKFILGVIIGFLIGYQLGRRAGQEGTGGTSGQGRKLADTARVGFGVVQRARASIQTRLGGDGEPDWN